MKKLLLFLCLATPALLSAQTNLYVDGSVTASGGGTSWTAAYKTLNEALNVVNAASTTVRYVVNVAAGTYYPTGAQSGTNRDSTFLLVRDRVTLLGGFPAGGGTRSIAANPTVLSGNIGTGTDSTDNSYHVMTIAGVGTLDTILIDGFRFERGTANGSNTKSFNSQSVPRNSGGGLCTYENGNRIIVSNCVFTLNAALWSGGGIYSVGTHSTPALGYVAGIFRTDSCLFQNNYAVQDGGGACLLYNGSAYAVTGCAFLQNRTIWGNGGGLYNEARSSTTRTVEFQMRGSSFVGNSAGSSGGGMFNICANTFFGSDAASNVSNCSFINNAAAVSASMYTYGMGGGGLYSLVDDISKNSTATYDSCVFTGNTATLGNGGGMIHLVAHTAFTRSTSYLNNCVMTGNAASNGGAMFVEVLGGWSEINRCRIQGNTASGDGGGIYTRAGMHLYYDSCQILGNAAANGGGLFNLNYTNNATSFNRLVIAGNTAGASGGGVHNMQGTTAEFKSTLISGNKAAQNGGGVYNTASAPTLLNCTLSGDTAANGWGIYNTSSSHPVVRNSIIWEGGTTDIFNTVNSVPVVTYSILQGGYSGTGNLTGNPLFVNALPASAAPTTGGNYQVYPCSPGINVGNNSGGASVGKDLKGGLRLVGTNVDLGAYEFPSVFPPVLTGRASACAADTIRLSTSVPGGTWSSSNTSVATVDANTGLVTTIAPGIDTITYSLVSSTCSVTVLNIITVNARPAVAAISGSSSVCLGATINLSTTSTGGAWSAANPAIATINSSGVVTSLSTGVDTFYYTVVNASGCSARAMHIVTVNPIPAVAALTGNNVVCAGSSTQFSSATTGGVWTSSDTAMSKVDATGLVTGYRSPGNPIIYTVTTAAGCSNTASMYIIVNALPAVGSISAPATLCMNTSTTLTNTVSGGAWSSADTTVAKISAAGAVTPVSAGAVTIWYVVTSAQGCKDSVSKTLNVAPVISAGLMATICQGDQYRLGSQILSTPGTYQETFSSSLGCDSVVTLVLSVLPLDLSVTQSGPQLSAGQAGGTYQWIDCDNGNSPIAGETLQSFTATANGQYAVIVTYGACTGTSACIPVSGLRVGGSAVGESFRVFPNPGPGRMTVAYDGAGSPDLLTVRDITGKQLLQLRPSGATIVLDLSSFAPGVYLLDCASGSIRETKRIQIMR